MSSGAFVSLLAGPLLSLGKPNEVGERSGLMFTITAFGAICGPPISGTIRKASEGWEMVGIYAGKCTGATRWGTGAYVISLCRYGHCGFCRSHGCYEMVGLRDALQREVVTCTCKLIFIL